ncbi:hypothetical protein EJ07DRAFT_175477 [Lizonia empirigonia]|nr:hypothetical protein EJ07DRAFT_175477 [Lizonia empirigonia]
MADHSVSQPPLGGDKAPAPATFSSFINKNTSGKKFAPKAARRRPAAAAPAPKPSHCDPEPAASITPAAAQLPTPAPTQEPAAPQTAPAEPSISPAVHDTPAAPTAIVAQPPALAPPPLTPQHARQTPAHVEPVGDDLEHGRSPKRRRIESPLPMAPVAVMLSQHAHTDETTPPQPQPRLDSPSVPTSAAEPSTAAAATPPDAEAPAQKRRRRTLPWTAVNHRHEDGGEASEAVEPPAKKKRAPPKPRGKKAAAPAPGEDGEQQEMGAEEEAEPTQSRPGARSRGPPSADAVEGAEGAEGAEAAEAAAPLVKKPRKPRKDKGKQRAAEGETVEGDGEQEGDPAAKSKRKPRAPKRTKTTPNAGENSSEEPKRRGRPPREATPPDAEDQQIDPDAMCMDDLASRNIRVGKLSRREREMRKIDWDAVKQRRREEDARHISTKETQAAVDKLLESGEVESAPTGPRYHVVDGRIELIQDSGTIDRERDADREIDAMLITEEDDLTTRITSRSFMKNNKRFPNEFVLPGQGKRWNPESTALFYQGLRSFGTDFQMIAHMFPGLTRRSIKTKFTREERDNPSLVRDSLRGKSQLASHWDHFLAASQLHDAEFADADAIKRDLAQEEVRMRAQINEALREKAEREKQRRIAGLTEEGGAAEEKKGRKKRAKEKSVAVREEGVEILGAVDEDPNWGVG